MPLTIDFRVRVPNELWPEIDTGALGSRYDDVLDTETKGAQTFEDLVAEMDAQGVDHALMHAEYEVGDPADALNRRVAGIIGKYPERFSGVGTVSMEPLDVMRAVGQIQECANMGMVGVGFQPSFFRMEITDRRLYPLYAKAAELGLFVAVHSGINYGVSHPIRNDHPLQICDVACDFPGLTLIAAHAGWPWIPEMVAVARKHPRVFMEFGGLSPKYLSAPGSGWEVMHRFMNNLLADQVLFGTDWPVMGAARTLPEWRELGLKPHVLEGLLGGNAQRILAERGRTLG